MTDAFRCNGCGEYYDAAFRFVDIEMHTDVVFATDLTLDDIPMEAYGILEGNFDTDANTGDFCIECGLAVLHDLGSEFGGDD